MCGKARELIADKVSWPINFKFESVSADSRSHQGSFAGKVLMTFAGAQEAKSSGRLATDVYVDVLSVAFLISQKSNHQAHGF